MLPQDMIVAVADGERLNLFHNAGDEAELQLSPAKHSSVDPRRSENLQKYPCQFYNAHGVDYLTD